MNFFSFLNKNKKFLIFETAVINFSNSGKLPLGHFDKPPLWNKKKIFIMKKMYRNIYYQHFKINLIITTSYFCLNKKTEYSKSKYLLQS